MKAIDLRRHAEIANDRDELNEIGIGQAKRLARELSDLPIFSSPAKRARQTAVWILIGAVAPGLRTDSLAGEQTEASEADQTRSAKLGGPSKSTEGAASALGRQIELVPDLGFGDQEKRWREAAERAGSSHVDAVKEQDTDLVATEAARVASGVRGLFDRISEAQRVMAISHSPLIEAAASELLPGEVIEPLAEGEGIRLILANDGTMKAERLPLPKPFLERPLGRTLGVVVLAPVLAFIATWPLYALLTWSYSTRLIAIEATAVAVGLTLTTLVLAFTVATSKRRESFLSGAKETSIQATKWQKRLARFRSSVTALFAPTWQGLAFMLLFIFLLAVLSFGSLSALLYQRGVASIAGSRVNDDTIMAKSLDFYMWQLLDTVPLLEIPETVRLTPPYTYRDHWTGVLLVIFKAFIILPLIRTAMFAYQKLTQERPLVS
jgi:broad specificity phosphatase PhoE